MQKKTFEMISILHVGRVTSLRNWVAKKLCHVQTLMNECSISDYPSNFEGLSLALHTILFFVLHPSDIISDQKVKAKKQKLHFFIPLGIPRVAHWIISFMLHISVITSLTN